MYPVLRMKTLNRCSDSNTTEKLLHVIISESNSSSFQDLVVYSDGMKATMTINQECALSAKMIIYRMYYIYSLQPLI